MTILAQQSKVQSAYRYHENFKKDRSTEDLRNAKIYIDEASTNESTSGKPKTWYYRGNIYLEIPKSELNGVFPNAMIDAAESYLKVFELDKEYEYAIESKNKGVGILMNQGVDYFNSKKYDQSIVCFEKVIQFTEKIGQIDSVALINAIGATTRAQKYSSAINYINKALSYKPKNAGNLYIQLERLYLQTGDTASCLNTISLARKSFPENGDLLIDELNLMLTAGKDSEAEKLFNEAISKNPNNVSLYLAAGSMYEKQKKLKEALNAYTKAVEVSPTAWEAYYNIGAYHVNEGKRLQDIANNEKDNKKYEAGSKLAEDELKKALPVLEKALQYAPAGNDRRDVLLALKQVYLRLKMDDQYNTVKKELDNK